MRNRFWKMLLFVVACNMVFGGILEAVGMGSVAIGAVFYVLTFLSACGFIALFEILWPDGEEAIEVRQPGDRDG